ncbi:hypothetical protein LTR53_008846 [Teratosphaeriaceae sp. CCFEE 6253]|nr:hypothetical protein LTR53_008846 [Teratosphaeriaceae sp. CCFEE 6253]
MDPGGLLLSIATIVICLDEITESYASASATLGLIKAQIRVLEAGTRRVQEWLHYTDPQSRAGVMASLGDAIGTVASSMERLNEDIAALAHTGPKTAKLLGKNGSSQWARTKFVYNEGRLRRHLTDVRECASLMHFTLNVCQLPNGPVAAQEVRELSLGAKTLHRAQTSARRERRSVMQQSGTAQSELHSEDYNDFVTSVMAAEEELPAESPAPSRQVSSESCSTGAESARQAAVPHRPLKDRSELVPPSPSSPTVRDPQDAQDGVAFETLAGPRTSSPGLIAAPSRPDVERQPSHNTLMREIGSMLGEKDHGAGQDSASPPPNIPLKNRQRLPRYTTADDRSGLYSQPQIRRKPVSRLSGDPSLPTHTPPFDRSDRGSYSPTSGTPSPDSSMMAKLTPLTESLRSLSSRDYINVELDTPPASPYVDHPPAYEPDTASSRPDAFSVVPRTRRRGTGGSSLARNVGVSITQYVRENRLQDISSALKDGYNVNETDPISGTTPIAEAARYRRWDAARLLLKSGAKLHVRDQDGNTPVHHAALEGDTEMVQMFLDAGGHAEDCNKLGLQPLQLAVAGGHTDTVLCLLNAVPYRKTNDEALVNAFLGAVKLGDTPTAQAVLSKGVKPKKMKDSWRMTSYAAQSGSLPMLELVLNEKASLKDRSPMGYTPLHFAAFQNHQPMVERLLSLKVPWKATTKKTGEVRDRHDPTA